MPKSKLPKSKLPKWKFALSKSKFVLIAALSLAAGPVLADAVPLRALTLDQVDAAAVGTARRGMLHVAIAADRPDATYALGEPVRLTVTTNADAYVTVLSFGPTGRVTQLFPNKYQPESRVRAERPLEIAGAGTGAEIIVGVPVGTELVKVVASTQPLTVVAESRLRGQGVFRSVEGDATAAVRDLQLVGRTAAQNRAEIVFVNFALYSVAGRRPSLPETSAPGRRPDAESAPLILPAAAPQAPAPLVPVPPRQPFPLLIAVDKPDYRLGDAVTLAVTTLQPCNLTVIDIAPSGRVRTLFPSETTSNNAVGAQQTVLVAGGSSATALRVSGPGGTEQILAICTTEPVPIRALADGDRIGLARDLAVVTARPAAATSIASVTFTVQP